MRTSVLTLALSLFLGTALANKTTKEHNTNMTIDASKSKVEWLAKKVTGQHNGDIKITSGSMVMHHNVLIGGEITIDMTSINTTDLEGDYKNKLDGHLHSADFFDTQKHKTATFKITKAEATAPNAYKITGDLTIKGITHPITISATTTTSGNQVILTSTFMVNRTKYDVKYGSGSFFDNLGDKTIDDEFELKLSLNAVKQH